MESVVLDILRSRGQSLALAEITSGGLASARLSTVDGAGEVFRGSVVPTAGTARQAILGVPVSTIGTAEAAGTLAAAVRDAFRTDIGLSTTGQHALGDFNQDAPGTTYLGIAVNDDVTVEQVRLPGDRERVKRYSVISLLNALRLRLISS